MANFGNFGTGSGSSSKNPTPYLGKGYLEGRTRFKKGIKVTDGNIIPSKAGLPLYTLGPNKVGGSVLQAAKANGTRAQAELRAEYNRVSGLLETGIKVGELQLQGDGIPWTFGSTQGRALAILAHLGEWKFPEDPVGEAKKWGSLLNYYLSTITE